MAGQLPVAPGFAALIGIGHRDGIHHDQGHAGKAQRGDAMVNQGPT